VLVQAQTGDIWLDQEKENAKKKKGSWVQIEGKGSIMKLVLPAPPRLPPALS